MGQVTLQNIQKSYGDTPVIRGLDMTVEDGEFMVFVGPSGCGKSTTLRMIAGLESISAGDLLIDGVRCNDVHPADRGAAMVFQSYALYPHMSVRDNMGFALKMAGKSKSEITAQVNQAAEILRITELLDRLPKDLSGGQRQRVAIGRAIVRKPKVFLFDEPLSNLDAALRVNMRIELSRLHKELGTTMIYVTHDQVEAMTMGNRIAVFNKGHVEQLGAPLELYNSPQNEFVAGFLGAPRINFIAKPQAQSSSAHQQMWQALLGADSQQAAQAAKAGIRPEHIRVSENQDGIAASVLMAEHLGDSSVLHLRIEGIEELLHIKQAAHHGTPLTSGDTVHLQPDRSWALAFDAEGKLIAKP